MAGPAGPKGRATPWLTDVISEMSAYLRLWAGPALQEYRINIIPNFKQKSRKKLATKRQKSEVRNQKKVWPQRSQRIKKIRHGLTLIYTEKKTIII